ncbi:MAG: PepSY-associated TM helix domain-containing protein [Pseudomonadota bacterium]
METLRQSMSWAHTWTGLLFGWVLYFMFVTGSAGYYDIEIDRWMQPERTAVVDVSDPIPLIEAALERGQAEMPDAIEHMVFLPIDRASTPFIRLFMSGEDEEGKRTFEVLELLADGTNAPEGRETAGGQTLYRLHWTFHYIPRVVGEVIAGLAAVFMFAAIISGIITHKKIFTDFFTLRLSKGQRTWLDSHNVISVMTLPFQIMITFSGILLVVTTFFMPIFVAQYGWGPDTVKTVEKEMFGRFTPVERSGEPAPPLDLRAMEAEFERQLPGESLNFMTVYNPGDATASVRLNGAVADGILRMSPNVKFEAATGEVTDVNPRRVEDSEDVANILEGLHEGLFAGTILRILFFVSGLLGAGMIATGLVLWTKKRRQKLRGDMRAERNLVIIERMNVGVVAGLAMAVAAFFYANRLLPVGLADRADWEMHVLFLTWLACILHSLVRRPEKGWTEQLAMTAGVFLFLPVLNALTSNLHLGNTLPLPGRPGELMMAGVDLWFIVIGLGFAYAARISAKKQVDPRVARRQKKQAVPVPAPAE